MKLSYTSLAAFLAHYELLKMQSQLDAGDRERLDAMSKIIADLPPAERTTLQAENSPDSVRHRERAERRLKQILTRRGILAS